MWTDTYYLYCYTSNECDSNNLTKDSLQNICSNCLGGSNIIKRSDVSCITNCPSTQIVTVSNNLTYCSELDVLLTISDNQSLIENTLKGRFSYKFDSVKSRWSNNKSDFIIKKI